VAPKHFAERNGLFVIVALGESIVAIGLGALGQERDIELVLTLLVAFAGAAALWWSYFDRAAPEAEYYLSHVTGRERSRFARDAYSLLHYPLVLGIMLYALAVHDMTAHPEDPLEGLGLRGLGSLDEPGATRGRGGHLPIGAKEPL
jgi:low temperature requirement protein LtrA